MIRPNMNNAGTFGPEIMQVLSRQDPDAATNWMVERETPAPPPLTRQEFQQNVPAQPQESMGMVRQRMLEEFLRRIQEQGTLPTPRQPDVYR